jgi:hypothetical protein
LKSSGVKDHLCFVLYEREVILLQFECVFEVIIILWDISGLRFQSSVVCFIYASWLVGHVDYSLQESARFNFRFSSTVNLL